MVEFLQNCEVAILDAQYTDEEYKRHVGWGHSSLSSVVLLALDANVKGFCFSITIPVMTMT